FSPDVVILAVEGKDWIPGLYSDYADAVEGGLSSAIEQAQREINALIDAVRKFTDAAILIHNFTVPAYPQFGVLDLRLQEGQSHSVLRLNEWLANKCIALPDVLCRRLFRACWPVWVTTVVRRSDEPYCPGADCHGHASASRPGIHEVLSCFCRSVEKMSRAGSGQYGVGR